MTFAGQKLFSRAKALLSHGVLGNKASALSKGPDGRIDRLDADGIAGWVYTTQQDWRERVRLDIEGVISMPLSVCHERADVLESGAAPELVTGFSLLFRDLGKEVKSELVPFFDGETPRTIRLAVGDKTIFDCQQALPCRVVLDVTDDETLKGSLDAVDAFGITGWVFQEDGRHLSETRLCIDNDLVIPLTVDMARPDVAEAVDGVSGPVGFCVTASMLDPSVLREFGRRFDNKGHEVTLMVGGDTVSSVGMVFARSFDLSLEDLGNGNFSGFVMAADWPHPITIEILLNGHAVERQRAVDVDVARASEAGMKWGCRFSGRLACGGVEAGTDTVSVRIAETIGQPEPGISVELPRRCPRQASVAVARAAMAKETGPSVTIVIPVFNAPDALEECLRSLYRFTDKKVHVVIIDDASTDPRIHDILTRAQSEHGASILRNEQNTGYTGSVMRAIGTVPDGDIVLLNSDTRVTPRWLANMRLAAAAPDVGTVTPLSDNAGAFSVPVPGASCDGRQAPDDAALARFVSQASGLVWPATPTGNGFCLYIKRACLKSVGGFDSEAFPRGYGEENDFCIRAGRLGWRHVVDDRTLVFHRYAASFGEEKVSLLAKAKAILNERYPEYDALVSSFVHGQPMGIVRARLAGAYTDGAGQEGKQPVRRALPRLLFVTSVTAGGTPMTNADLMAGLEEDYDTLLLQCDGRRMTLSFVNGREARLLETHDLAVPIDPVTHRSEEYDAVVAEWLVAYAVELVHIRHIAWHSLGLTTVARQLFIPAVFSFHDYYTVCPTVKLLDEKATYCAGQCTVQSDQDCEPDLWPGFDTPPLKHRWVHPWRQNMMRMLSDCDVFVTTSETARAVVSRNFPDIDGKSVAVIPHGRDFDRMVPPHEWPWPGEGPLKVLLPGATSPAKGADLIAGIAALDEEGRFEFHIMGNAGAMPPQDGIIWHGRYDREKFQDVATEIQPHIGAVLSLWPETYCHTLTELWAAGLPVVGLNIGAVGERLGLSAGGWLVEIDDAVLGDSLTAKLYAQFAAIQENRDTLQRAKQEVAALQPGLHEQNTECMAQRYALVYEGQLEGNKRKKQRLKA